MKTRIRMAGQGVINGMGHVILAGVLLLAAVALVAPLRAGRQLRHDLDATHKRLAELDVLYPLYAELMAMEKPADWSGLSTSAPRGLSEPEIVSVPGRFMSQARESNFELNTISPQVQKDGQGGRFLRVDVRGNGAYAQLREFLIRVARNPELKRIHKLEVRRDARQEQLHLVADLALE